MAKKAVATRAGGIEVELTSEEVLQIEKDEAVWTANASSRALEEVHMMRISAYREQSDPLFFQEQRGEVSAGTWKAKVEEIKAEHPKPE
tara:strand:+ start:578 stop:844 length:267 start_codon:yes stop_codon:yes gene_type:complete